MKAIAVAGGTGGVGRTIVDALVKYGQHEVYVLSRSDRPTDRSIKYLKFDYDNIEGGSKALEEAGISIIICAISVVTAAANQAQINLIRAAEKASCTERFVVSSFDLLHLEEDIALSPLAKYVFEALGELQKTKLTYTRIVNGWFLDYYGMPNWRTHMEPWINVLSMEKKWAVVPGGRDVQASFITSQDMASLVARLMDLPRWDKITAIHGNTCTFEELIRAAEHARGCPFQVVVDSEAKLKAGKISFATEFPDIGHGDGNEAFFAMIHYLAAIGRYLVPRHLAPLDAEFPELKITSPQEVMEVGWKSRRVQDVSLLGLL